MALSYRGISQSELARRIGTTPQNLNQKVKHNTLTKEELEQIAIAIDGTWHAEFVFPDGTKIGGAMEHRLSKTRLYSIYSGIKQRCYNPNNQHYQWYSGNG